MLLASRSLSFIGLEFFEYHFRILNIQNEPRFYYYNKLVFYGANKTISYFQIVEQIEAGMFTPEQPDQLRDLTNMLRHHDRFLVCADFDAFVACQDKVSFWLLAFVSVSSGRRDYA